MQQVQHLAFIGIGKVGFALARNLQRKGHRITIATDNPESDSVKKALAECPDFKVQPVQDAIDAADLVFLAIPFQANEATLPALRFQGKTLVDCTNPVGPGISHGLNSERSGSERVQELAPDARVVKAFSIYGFENFADSAFPAYSVLPAMLIAGNDPAAKQQVAALCTDLGFEAVDTGALAQALHLEHMTLLWVKMVRTGGMNPHLAWAKLA
jgi:hypothetical protein